MSRSQFNYYWDADLFEALVRYRMRPYLAEVILAYEGNTMATPADIQRLVDGMRRAQTLIGRAANDAERNGGIMDRFEQRLNLSSEHFKKIDEYEKQLAAMDNMGNGGEPLDDTFPAAARDAPSSEIKLVTAIHPSTGDPVK